MGQAEERRRRRGAEARLLVVEDDPAMATLMRWTFEREDFEVSSTPSGEEALLLAAETGPDLVLLDWMLEDLSGIEVCRRLRRGAATASLPIIMVTARGEEADRIRGLETGADDFITKPFSPAELVARARALLRRVRPALAGMTLSFDDLQLDPAAFRVRRGGAAVPLGPTEFKLLRYFLENPALVLSRERLLDAVWGRDSEIDARTVDVYIRRLRQAINAGGGRDLIRTVRSAGYALDSEA
ncbi:MAG TPA: phosphate regulon transcriptional regulator PhoB [Allosphingosinicella sp.]|jgi:two-component system phosphate regulon response regulator PhoB